MKISSLCVLLCLSCSVAGQDYPRGELDLSKITDALYGYQDEDLAYEELYENVMQILSHPVNINSASEEDLRFLNLLSNTQISNFLRYRRQNGDLLSVYELQVIPSFDLETANKLAPFVKVVDPSTTLDARYLKSLRKETDSYFLTRYERSLQSRKGDGHLASPDQQFKGSPDKLYVRMRSSRPGDYSVGFTAEKDAGEPIAWHPGNHYYGLDYLSFHLQLQNKGRLKNLIIGDYQTQFGQGLMLGGMLGMGKGSETITTIRRSNIGAIPYTSAYEAGYLRGASATIQLTKYFRLTAFYSFARRDASLAADTTASEEISAFQTSGLHRNERELSLRHKVRDINWGTVLQYTTPQLDAGIMFNDVSFNLPVNPIPNSYNYFAFEGNRNRNVGLFINYTLQNVSFFTEVSQTIGNGNALTAGALMSLTDNVELSVLYRKFDRNFHSFYSNALGENTLTQNETGMYWGWKYHLNKKLMLAGYVDLFRFPWLRYRDYAPSSGHEWLVRLSYQPTRSIVLYLQAREEKKDRNINSEQNAIYQTGAGKKYNYWINLDYGLRKGLRLKTRGQFSTFTFAGHTTAGMALAQDIQFTIYKFKITARYALFDTDDYDNRQYIYENDVYLAYAMPAYASAGVRKVILAEYKFSRHISLWLRYAHFRYPKVSSIGSGVDTIAGNVKNDVKFQVMIRF